MKFSDLKKRFFDKEKEEQAPTQRNRRLLISLILKLILLFMVAIAILYGIGSAIFGAALVIPRSAVGVLDSAKSPAAYRWTSESLRQLQIHDHSETQAGSRTVAVNVPADRFFASTFGVTPTKVAYISDGETTVQVTSADTESATDRRDGTLLNDSCAAIGMPKTETVEDDGAIPASLLAFPTAEMFKKASPEIITDKGTFLGQRAWVIGFQPNSEIVERLLWVPFLEKAMQNETFAKDRLWIIGEEERAALENGDFEISEDENGRPWSFVWVTRDERRISQVDIRFRINLGEGVSSEYRLFAHVFQDDKPISTSGLNLGKPKRIDCLG